MPAVDSPGDDESNVDREIRIERMKRELEELSDGAMISGSVGDVPPELEKIFLERACAFEKASYGTNFDRLVERGVEMIPPAELDDRELRVKLQEVVCALAAIRCFLHDTDHLSDRELYTWAVVRGAARRNAGLITIGGCLAYKSDRQWH